MHIVELKQNREKKEIENNCMYSVFYSFFLFFLNSEPSRLLPGGAVITPHHKPERQSRERKREIEKEKRRNQRRSHVNYTFTSENVVFTIII